MHEKKYNHYVPKFHLANFSGNKNCIDKYLHKSGKIIRNAPTKTTAGADYLYGKEPDIENALAEFEKKCAPIIKDIIRTGCLPNDSVKLDYVVSFFAISDARTLIKGKNYLNLWKERYKSIARMYQAHGALDVPDNMIDCIEVSSDIPNFSALKNIDKVYDACSDLKVDVIYNISNVRFITGDCPVVRYNQFFMDRKYYRPYGYGHIGVQIFLPISPDYCLVMYDPIPYDKHGYDNGKFTIDSSNEAEKINTLIAGYADAEIYFGSQSNDRDIKKVIECVDHNALKCGPIQCGDSNHLFEYNFDPCYWSNIHFDIFTTKSEFMDIDLPADWGGPVRPRFENVE